MQTNQNFDWANRTLKELSAGNQQSHIVARQLGHVWQWVHANQGKLNASELGKISQGTLEVLSAHKGSLSAAHHAEFSHQAAQARQELRTHYAGAPLTARSVAAADRALQAPRAPLTDRPATQEKPSATRAPAIQKQATPSRTPTVRAAPSSPAKPVTHQGTQPTASTTRKPLQATPKTTSSGVAVPKLDLSRLQQPGDDIGARSQLTFRTPQQTAHKPSAPEAAPPSHARPTAHPHPSTAQVVSSGVAVPKLDLSRLQQPSDDIGARSQLTFRTPQQTAHKPSAPEAAPLSHARSPAHPHPSTAQVVSSGVAVPKLDLSRLQQPGDDIGARSQLTFRTPQQAAHKPSASQAQRSSSESSSSESSSSSFSSEKSSLVEDATYLDSERDHLHLQEQEEARQRRAVAEDPSTLSQASPTLQRQILHEHINFLRYANEDLQRTLITADPTCLKCAKDSLQKEYALKEPSTYFKHAFSTFQYELLAKREHQALSIYASDAVRKGLGQ